MRFLLLMSALSCLGQQCLGLYRLGLYGLGMTDAPRSPGDGTDRDREGKALTADGWQLTTSR